ncbi:unnamed protein product [Ilex paraguariensis]|uniref:Uncharacterized protein n=1 Tax=Ilex paraguariensis TaxID=185542 RepID=A0ABC8TCD4_9AQUA
MEACHKPVLLLEPCGCIKVVALKIVFKKIIKLNGLCTRVKIAHSRTYSRWKKKLMHYKLLIPPSTIVEFTVSIVCYADLESGFISRENFKAVISSILRKAKGWMSCKGLGSILKLLPFFLLLGGLWLIPYFCFLKLSIDRCLMLGGWSLTDVSYSEEGFGLRKFGNVVQGIYWAQLTIFFNEDSLKKLGNAGAQLQVDLLFINSLCGIRRQGTISLLNLDQGCP